MLNRYNMCINWIERTIMIIKNYSKVNRDTIMTTLEPDLIEGSRVMQLDFDKEDNTVFVEVIEGYYEGITYWLPAEMVDFD